MNHQQIITKLASARVLFESAAQAVRDERAEVHDAELHIEHVEEAQAIIQAVSQSVQEQVHDRIAGIVTHCLQTVFGPDAYEFHLVFEKKRGRTECRPVFMRNGNEVAPLNGGGGGAADVAAFGLRLICLVLSRPEVRKLLVLDEPWKFLSQEYRENLCNLVLELSESMGLQFIIVTHSEEFKMGHVVELD